MKKIMETIDLHSVVICWTNYVNIHFEITFVQLFVVE